MVASREHRKYMFVLGFSIKWYIVGFTLSTLLLERVHGYPLDCCALEMVWTWG
jgi:hypothetical protein